MSPQDHDGFSRLLTPLFWALVAAGAAVAILSSWELRVLHADGAFYLLYMLETQDFTFFEPARRAVDFLTQCPVVAALKAGVTDIRSLTILYGLAATLPSVALVAACRVVAPPARKELAVFPLLNFIAGSLGAAASPIASGPPAVAYFWLILFLVLFRTRSAGMLLLTVLLSMPLIVMHETLTVLCPLLAAAAVWRALGERSPAGRTVLLVLAGWFIVVAVVQASHIVHPRSIENRDVLMENSLALRWLVNGAGELNGPAFTGLLALAAFPLLRLAGSAARRPARLFLVGLVLCAFCAAALYAGLGPAVAGSPIDSAMQFKARYLSVVVTLLLAPAMLAFLIRPGLGKAWGLRASLVVVGVAGAAAVAWQTTAIQQWSRYIEDYENILASHRGLIAWQAALDTLASHDRGRFEKMSWGWTNPTMSFVLAPGGNVATVIDNPDNTGWEPFDPKDLDSLPDGPLLNADAFREAVRAGR